jgi:hypothetical protein
MKRGWKNANRPEKFFYIHEAENKNRLAGKQKLIIRLMMENI